jgi:conjugative relaxase-like TrwC/TraI family protein
MLSICPISCGDYLSYVEEEGPGEWVGTGSRIMELPKEVTAEDYRAVRLGLHPETGESLRVRQVVDRTYNKPWGPETYKARELFDLVISAPKTISIMNFDPRVSEAHQMAVARTWREMEHLCGAMVIAEYPHHYSRALDPQEHTHLLTPNLAFDGNKWRTLHVNNLYREQAQLTEQYREKLLSQLEREGYRIKYPELADVPEEVVEKFSQRSREKEAGMREHAARHGIPPEALTNKERAVIVRDTRSEKQLFPRERVQAMQWARLSNSERIELLRIRDLSLDRPRERINLNSYNKYEPEAPREHWDYGETDSFRSMPF